MRLLGYLIQLTLIDEEAAGSFVKPRRQTTLSPDFRDAKGPDR